MYYYSGEQMIAHDLMLRLRYFFSKKDLQLELLHFFCLSCLSHATLLQSSLYFGGIVEFLRHELFELDSGHSGYFSFTTAAK